MKTIAIIPADIEKPIEFRDVEKTSLGLYQGIVKGSDDGYDRGYIEAVRLRDNEGVVAMDLYVNEEGLLLQLPYNERATVLLMLSMGLPAALKHGAFLAGDAAVIGGVDANGNDKGLTKTQTAFLKAFQTRYMLERGQ